MAKVVVQVGPMAVVIKDDRAKLTDERVRLWAELACNAGVALAEALGVEDETEEKNPDA